MDSIGGSVGRVAYPPGRCDAKRRDVRGLNERQLTLVWYSPFVSETYLRAQLMIWKRGRRGGKGADILCGRPSGRYRR
jgi:hypothetical protein